MTTINVCDCCDQEATKILSDDGGSETQRFCSDCFQELECQGCFKALDLRPDDPTMVLLRKCLEKKKVLGLVQGAEIRLCSGCGYPFHAVCLALCSATNPAQCQDCTNDA